MVNAVIDQSLGGRLDALRVTAGLSDRAVVLWWRQLSWIGAQCLLANWLLDPSWWIALMGGVAILAPVVHRRPFWRRSLTIAAVSVLLAAVGIAATTQGSPDRTDPWPLIGVAASLGLQVALLYLGSIPRRVSHGLLLLGWFTLLQLLPLLADEEIPRLTSWVVQAVVWLGAWLSLRCAPSPATVVSRRGQVALLSVAAFATFGSFVLADWWSGWVARIQVPWSAVSVGNEGTAGVHAYVRIGSLDSVTQAKHDDPRRVALRIYADEPPGYLRGRVFDTYRGGRWISSTRVGRKWNDLEDKRVVAPSADMPPGAQLSRGENWFEVGPSSERPLRELVIHNDPTRGDVFFAPLHYGAVAGRGGFLAVDPHGVLYRGLDPSVPYRIFSLQKPPSDVLDPKLASQLLTVPEELQPPVQRLRNELGAAFGGMDDRNRIQAVSEYLQGKGSYAERGFRPPPGRDPLEYFLSERPAAHCELFASAAVMLLRSMGIPSRYASGYVATELEPEYGDYWLARNSNSHAWAEAYDRQSRRWTVVEATPGMTPVERTDDLATATGAGGQRRSSDDQPPWTSVVRWLEFRGLATSWSTRLVGLGLVLCGAAWYWRRRPTAAASRMASRSPSSRQGDNLQRAAAQEYDRLCRRLKRRDLTRRPPETLCQFASRLEQAARDQNDPWLVHVAKFMQEFAHVRYLPERPSLYGRAAAYSSSRRAEVER